MCALLVTIPAILLSTGDTWTKATELLCRMVLSGKIKWCLPHDLQLSETDHKRTVPTDLESLLGAKLLCFPGSIIFP